jgi:hypothetical protein
MEAVVVANAATGRVMNWFQASAERLRIDL